MCAAEQIVAAVFRKSSLRSVWPILWKVLPYLTEEGVLNARGVIFFKCSSPVIFIKS